MAKKTAFIYIFNGLLTIMLAALISRPVLAEMHGPSCTCMQTVVNKIMEIRSLPEKRSLHTLDGQTVLLAEFYAKSYQLFPACSLPDKFYYFPNEIIEITSRTSKGMKKHKIRRYNNCLSTYCPDSQYNGKIYGDVAEFYDSDGIFMGLSVYMGDGKYCSLPYDGY